MSKEQEQEQERERGLGTADFVAAVHARTATDTQGDFEEAPGKGQAEAERVSDTRMQAEPLAALFTPEAAQDFQSRWDAVQIGFVDDPGEAVRKADELVAQVMKSLTESFAHERAHFEGQLGGQEDSASTENMRVALRRYRSFFQRLLSL